MLVANEGFAYFGSILSYLIVAIPIFAGAFEGKDAGQLSEIISKVQHSRGQQKAVCNRYSHFTSILIEFFLCHVSNISIYYNH